MGCKNDSSSKKHCCGKTTTETVTTVTQSGGVMCDVPQGNLMYVGARLLPVFADPVEWSSDRPYEQLVMVQHDGNTYMSRYPVPVGEPLPAEGEQSNAYWVKMDNWSAQIAEYIAEVQSFNNRISQTETGISELNEKFPVSDIADGAVTSAKIADGSISANDIADGAITSAKIADGTIATADIADSAISTAKLANNSVTSAKIVDGTITASDLSTTAVMPANAFKNKKSICFGDSNGWGQMSYLEANIYRRICNKLGCTYNNKAVSNATWQSGINVGGVTNDFGMQIDAESADNEVALVVIIGGINDFHYAPINVTNFGNAIISVLNKAKNKYPNAVIMTIFDGGKQLPNENMLYYQQVLSVRGSDVASPVVNVPTLDICLNDTRFYNQNHYNDSGCEVVASRAVKSLFGGTFPLEVPLSQRNIATSTADAQGYSGLYTNTFTFLDPLTFTRVDRITLYFATNFTHTSNTVIPASNTIINAAGCLQNTDSGLFILPFRKSSGNETTVIHVPAKLVETNASSVTDSPILALQLQSAQNLATLNGANCYHTLEITSSGAFRQLNIT